MISRAKIVALTAGLVLLGVIIVLIWISTGRASPSSVTRLPDGSWLKVVSVSYGSGHSYNMPRPKPWQSFLLKHLPASWSAHLDLWQGTGSVGVNAPPGKTNLAIITICKQASAATLGSSAQIDVFDQQGHKLGTALIGPTATNSDGKHRRQLAAWVLNSDSELPHDTKTLLLRLSELAADGKTRQQIAEFSIENPAGKVGRQ